MFSITLQVCKVVVDYIPNLLLFSYSMISHLKLSAIFRISVEVASFGHFFRFAIDDDEVEPSAGVVHSFLHVIITERKINE